MYSGSGYSDWEIGDVDVIVHKGVYHLFHLIIPNHDYIAHAVSKDGISWKRTKNALFVGDPGEWDDDMLWTMQVSRHGNQFRMYYTGLQREDRGVAQRIGLATSEDLLHWTKIEAPGLPAGSEGPYYEDISNNPRGWLSCRDPFFFQEGGESYLLVCMRSSSGPVSRRGCAGLARISGERFEWQKPLVYPMVYDDIECPCIFKMKGKYFLIGSIREDIKVRYWFADAFQAEYHSFRSDVLLPQGNYAARIVPDGDHLLVYNFFFSDGDVNRLRVLPPPKELDVDEEGRLQLKSFYRWALMVQQEICQAQFSTARKLLNNPTSHMERKAENWRVESRSGYEIFMIERPSESFIWEGEMIVEGMGKFGLVTDIDDEGNGYYISFDITNGFVYIRSWGFNPHNNKENFVFKNIQGNIFYTFHPHTIRFQLIRYGNYIELSIDDTVRLTLIDYTYSGDNIGIYTASSKLSLRNMYLKTLPSPESEYASQKEAMEE
jgi:beta-fructofuranosidase